MLDFSQHTSHHQIKRDVEEDGGAGQDHVPAGFVETFEVSQGPFQSCRSFSLSLFEENSGIAIAHADVMTNQSVLRLWPNFGPLGPRLRGPITRHDPADVDFIAINSCQGLRSSKGFYEVVMH